MTSEAALLSEAEILSAIVEPNEPGLSPASARAILDLQFRQPAVARLNLLAEKNRLGTLTDTERGELESYQRVGNLINLLQAKARHSLLLREGPG